MPLVDVKFFVTAVMLQRETGGNLAEILDNLSYVIRERFKIMRQVRVYTAQGRLTMMLLMGMPPIIVVTMLTTNPIFIRPLFADPIGHAYAQTLGRRPHHQRNRRLHLERSKSHERSGNALPGFCPAAPARDSPGADSSL